MNTPSTFQRARDLFADQHNGHDPLDAWPCPDSTTQFVASCEWRLWQAYKRLSRAYPQGEGLPPSQQEFADWTLGFYIKLATSEHIRQVCEGQCRSRAHADALLGLLFRDSDIICSGLPDGSAVFCSTHVRNRLSAKAQQEEKRRAKHDRKALTAIRSRIDQLTGPDDSPRKLELRKASALYEPSALALTDGPTEIVFNVDGRTNIIRPDPPHVPSPCTPSSGHPRFTGADTNTYLELVRRLVRQAYAGRDYVKMTGRVVHDFSPALLPENYFTSHYPDKDRLSPRLAAFLKIPLSSTGPAPEFPTMRRLVDWYEAMYLTTSSFTRLTASSSAAS